jgi:outer membrane protein OmpA-like peptidoglycan-associated protein
MTPRQSIAGSAVIVAAGIVAALVLARPGTPQAIASRPASRAGDSASGHVGKAPFEFLTDDLATTMKSGRAIVVDLQFIGGSDSLPPSADTAITRLAALFAGTTGAFLIEAHSAPSGDALLDQWLTDRRAAAVRARLIAAGVPSARLFAMGFGATRPPRASKLVPRARIEVSRMP